MVVLPFVPVTPTSFSLLDGLPKYVVAAMPTQSSVDSTCTYVTPSCISSGISSSSTAAAPSSIALPINLCPSTCVPFMATKI